MTKLTTKARNMLPKSEFAGPNRTYPIPNASHAKNALARAAQQKNTGALSEHAYESIVSRARKKLGK